MYSNSRPKIPLEARRILKNLDRASLLRISQLKYKTSLTLNKNLNPLADNYNQTQYMIENAQKSLKSIEEYKFEPSTYTYSQDSTLGKPRT